MWEAGKARQRIAFIFMTNTPDNYILQSGYLDVGDGHKIYWEDWGNPESFPVMHFHGGPGPGFNDRHKMLYNSQKQRVIFFDQRGAGKSTPLGETKNNTTQKLIEDTEKLRKYLGVNKMYLAGGSWGSALVLLYAIAHPERVKAMVAWSIYLARKLDTDYVSEGYQRFNYPEAWERFITLVPLKYRTNGDSITKFYSDKINSRNKQVALKYADEWSLWESSLCTISYDRQSMEKEVLGDPDNLVVGKLETHYFYNGCFVPENFILSNIKKIRHLPLFVVQGRFDACTPPYIAYDLFKAYGKKMSLKIVAAGHLRTDPEMLKTLRLTIQKRFK